MHAVASGSNEEAGQHSEHEAGCPLFSCHCHFACKDRRLLLIGLLRFFELAAKAGFSRALHAICHASCSLPGCPGTWPVTGLGKDEGGPDLCLPQTMSSRDDTISYLMPRRHGLEFGLYPWHGHLKDAAKGTKNMLVALREWHHLDVREVGLHKSWL